MRGPLKSCARGLVSFAVGCAVGYFAHEWRQRKFIDPEKRKQRNPQEKSEEEEEDEDITSNNKSSQRSPKKHLLPGGSIQAFLQKSFGFSTQDLLQVSDDMLREFRKGLKEEGAQVPMLPSYITTLPDGRETGDFYALDVGGSNLRVLSVSLVGDSKYNISGKKSEIPEHIRRAGSAEDLFGYIADKVLEVVPTEDTSEKKKLGFTFSFPVSQTSLNKGTLLRWTKGFSASGCVGEDICQLLQRELSKRAKNKIEVGALVNDTCGTLMARALVDPATKIGLIVGTGVNACYVEKQERIPKLESNEGDMIINTEVCAFTAASLRRTEFDEAIDHFEISNKNVRNKQHFEKMTSGLYQSEIVRHVVLKLHQQGFLFLGHQQLPQEWRTSMSLNTTGMAQIEGDDDPNLSTTEAILVREMNTYGSTLRDRAYLKAICSAISTRAAKLTAVAIFTLLRHLDLEPSQKVTCAVDGSVFKFYPMFKENLKATVMQLQIQTGTRCSLLIEDAEDGSGVGAAACVASGVRQDQLRGGSSKMKPTRHALLGTTNRKSSRDLLNDAEMKSLKGVQDFLAKKFEFSTADLLAVSEAFQKEFTCGLEKEGQMLPMLPTYLTDLPTGKEFGEFYALDLGGSNFRVLAVSLLGEGQHKIDGRKFSVPEAIMTSDADELFGYIADRVLEVIPRTEAQKKLGFTFSFPVNQVGLNRGILLQWTKGFSARNCVNQDVVRLLEKALAVRCETNIEIVALVNDTCGTLMAKALTDTNTRIGLIVGTGINACYVEAIDNIKKQFADQKSMMKKENMIVNTEMGAFQGPSLKRTEFDESVDRYSQNPGRQHFEKMISGMYLGEIVRCVVVGLHEQGFIFEQDALPDEWKTKNSFTTVSMGAVQNDADVHLKATEAILTREMSSYGSTLRDRAILKAVCKAVSLRGAQLAGAAVFALLRKQSSMSHNEKITCAVDGSVFKFYPMFRESLRTTVSSLMEESGEFWDVQIVDAEDGSGVGAAASVACAGNNVNDSLIASTSRSGF